MPKCPECGGELFPLKVVRCGKCQTYYENLIDLGIENDTKALAEKATRVELNIQNIHKQLKELTAIIKRAIGGK